MSLQRNARGEPLQPSVLRCEYGDGNTIGESAKVTADGETGGAEIDFTAVISLEQDVADWNQLANTPLASEYIMAPHVSACDTFKIHYN